MKKRDVAVDFLRKLIESNKNHCDETMSQGNMKKYQLVAMKHIDDDVTCKEWVPQ